ncbi:hypothetical protein DFR49_1696 [Hephaestia caeni]|uniref:NAD(P) transhydrogenase beta subunit n=1 Tax=Hephaestia caeni TaxID=645617 RepID=A0A397PDT2_9SPHN|nr:hypothetical protein [Hephaestia caeni]RIA47128.1 hypothetical protein DFR49_1696 [Hephaestia caeni]
MLVYAVIAFAVAAVGGLVLAASVLRGRLAPWALSLVHAALGATGLVLTLVAVLGGAGGHASLALIILLVAALGGFFLASFHLRKAPAPKPVVVVHAAVAVIGFVLLASTAFGIA